MTINDWAMAKECFEAKVGLTPGSELERMMKNNEINMESDGGWRRQSRTG